MTVKARKRKEQRGFRLVAGTAAALAVIFLAWVGFGLGGHTATKLFSNLFQAAAALGAAAACSAPPAATPTASARSWTTSLHRAWRLLGGAALAWGAARSSGPTRSSASPRTGR